MTPALTLTTFLDKNTAFFSQHFQFSIPAFVGHDLNENLVPRTDLKGIYTSDLLNDRSVQVIEDHDPSKPLFLYLSHIAPHSGEKETPLQAPEDVIENYSYIPDKDKQIYAGKSLM